jgi:hypothetical protein
MKTLNRSCVFCEQRLNTSFIPNIAFCEHCKVYHSFFKDELFVLAFYFNKDFELTDDSQAGYNLILAINSNTYSLELKDKIIVDNLPNANHISPNNAKDVAVRLSKLKAYI